MRKRPPLINELLIQGKDFTNQLKEHLEKPIPSSSAADDETRRSLLLCEPSLLVDKILSSYEKALSLLHLHNNNNNITTIISSHQLSPPFSSSSNSSGAPGHDEIPTTHHHHNINPSCNTNIFKKRKTKGISKYGSEQVVMKKKVCTAEGGDGYSWRKYGQKDILGAHHPRAYYRCTHRNVQGCLATKQIQRSDEDASVFEVTYKGRHTCLTQPSKALLSEKNLNQQEEEDDSKPTHKMFIERVFSFKANNKSEEKGLVPNNSFSFASTPIETEKLEKLFHLGCDPVTFHYDVNLQNLDSDVSAEMMKSTPINSSTNSPLVVDWEFSLDREDFDGNFYFATEMFT
uniref:probable WRKY transcription factor 53 n=1 Tax=Erigeron canadensis TaxID=72917 RepID=UPI001CB95C96|nr:probable WRKY transcription factor 53 [Erigeron canadensis]